MFNPTTSLIKNKYVLTTAAILAMALLLLIGIRMLRMQVNEVPPIQPPIEIPSPTPLIIPTVPTGTTFTISGVTVKNFYKNPIESNNTNDVIFFENADYSMTYVAAFEQFYISIENPNFLITREEAEKKFLELLGINEKDACQLNVEESVPVLSQSVYAGGVYPLSFCENNSN